MKNNQFYNIRRYLCLEKALALVREIKDNAIGKSEINWLSIYSKAEDEVLNDLKNFGNSVKEFNKFLKSKNLTYQASNIADIQDLTNYELKNVFSKEALRTAINNAIKRDSLIIPQAGTYSEQKNNKKPIELNYKTFREELPLVLDTNTLNSLPVISNLPVDPPFPLFTGPYKKIKNSFSSSDSQAKTFFTQVTISSILVASGLIANTFKYGKDNYPCFEPNQPVIIRWSFLEDTFRDFRGLKFLDTKTKLEIKREFYKMLFPQEFYDKKEKVTYFVHLMKYFTCSIRNLDDHPFDLEFANSEILMNSESIITFEFLTDNIPVSVKNKDKNKKNKSERNDPFVKVPFNFWELIVNIKMEYEKNNPDFSSCHSQSLAVTSYIILIETILYVVQNMYKNAGLYSRVVIRSITLRAFMIDSEFKNYIKYRKYDKLREILNLLNFIFDNSLNVMHISWEIPLTNNSNLTLTINANSIINRDYIYDRNDAWKNAEEITKATIKFSEDKFADIVTDFEKLKLKENIYYSSFTVKGSIFSTIHIPPLLKEKKDLRSLHILRNDVIVRWCTLKLDINIIFKQNQDEDSILYSVFKHYKLKMLKFINKMFSELKKGYSEEHENVFAEFYMAIKRIDSRKKEFFPLNKWLQTTHYYFYLYPEVFTFKFLRKYDITDLDVLEEKFITENSTDNISTYVFDKKTMKLNPPIKTKKSKIKQLENENSKILALGRMYECPRKIILNAKLGLCDSLISITNKLNFRSLFMAYTTSKALDKKLVILDFRGLHGNIVICFEKLLNPNLDVKSPINWEQVTLEIYESFLGKNPYLSADYISQTLCINKSVIKQWFLAFINGRPLDRGIESTPFWNEVILRKENLTIYKYQSVKGIVIKQPVVRSKYYKQFKEIEECIRAHTLAKIFQNFYQRINSNPTTLFGKSIPNDFKGGTKTHYFLTILEGVLLDSIILDLTLCPTLTILNLDYDGISFAVPTNFRIEDIDFDTYNETCSELFKEILPLTIEEWIVEG